MIRSQFEPFIPLIMTVFELDGLGDENHPGRFYHEKTHEIEDYISLFFMYDHTYLFT